MNTKQNNLLEPKSIQELIEEQVVREGGLKPKPVKPLDSPVLAQSHTAIYKMHRYWARRPHNVFAHIIQHYTNPGDMILDPFCGGGVTVVESLRLRRRVVGIDINPLATWITQVEVEPVDLVELETAFNDWYQWCVEKVSPLFKAECGNCGNEDAQAEWYEWSNVIVCPNCGHGVVLAYAKKERNAVYTCTNTICSAKFKPSKLERLPDRMVAVKTRCESCGETDIRKPIESDINLAEEIADTEGGIVKDEKLFIPDDEFPDMNYVRENDLYTKGFHHFKDFFTPRQRIGISKSRQFIEHCNSDESVYYSLLTAFSSSLRNTNKLTARNVAWRGGNPEWGGHMYWPPSIYCEASPLLFIKRNLKSQLLGKSFQEKEINGFYSPDESAYLNHELNKNVTCKLITNSSEQMPLSNKMVDCIITDPPFGGNVQYLELSDFYLVWLKSLVRWKISTDKSREGIQTRHQGFEGAKDLDHYENVLFNVFKECRRVLKPEGWMVMTFHNKDIGVWMALHRAAQRAGFKMPSQEEARDRGMIYQPAVKNYEQTIHLKRSGSLLGDFILTFKPTEYSGELEAIRYNLTLDEEKNLQAKAEEFIRYHGGVEERDLWTGLMPYLSDTGILARVAKFSIKALLSTGPFTYVKKEKKWYMNDMLENGSLSATSVIKADQLTQQLVYSYLREKKHARLDDLLKVIYKTLTNSQIPQMTSIERVLTKYCKPIKIKGEKRDVYVWSPGKLAPMEEERIKLMQTSFGFEQTYVHDHNSIITMIARSAIKSNYDVHVGKTEQRKSPTLKNLSMDLTGFELGLPPDSFEMIREIDLLILQKSHILSAIEVTTTLSTLNKAVNDRFRNLLTVAPNLKISLYVVVKDDNYRQAKSEIHKAANIKSGLSKIIRIIKISDLDESELPGMFIEM